MTIDIDDLIAYRVEELIKSSKTQNRPNHIYAARDSSNLRLVDKSVTIGYAELFGKNHDNLFAIVAEYSNHKDWFEYRVWGFVDSENKTEEFLKTFKEMNSTECDLNSGFVGLFFVHVKVVD